MWLAHLFTVLLFAGAIPAQGGSQAPDSAGCTGTVLDENGVPIAAAQVQLEDSEGQVHRTETNGTGHFTLNNLLPGDYKAEVRKEGFFVLTGQAITLHAGANELSFDLNHEQEIHEQVEVVARPNQIETQDTAQ